MTCLRPFVLIALALVLPVTAADAQRRTRGTYRYQSSIPSREISLVVGVLNYDFADDNDFPTAALRLNWRLARYVRSEVSFSYALGDVAPTAANATEDEIDSHLLAATVGIEAELPTPVIRPYVGAATGIFARLDDEGGDDFARPTHAFPLGLRVLLSERLGLRAEVRWRFDEHQDGRTAVNTEQTVGLRFAF